MKKTSVLFAALLMTLSMSAASYGILVNGRYYFAADYKGPDAMGEGFEEYLAHVQVNSGDYCQMYDAENKAAWAKPLNTYSVAGFTYDAANNRYNVTTSGCFDFYIKLKWEADELYVGPAGEGVVCGEGIDITKEDPQPGYSGSAPAQCPDVILQAFYWDSYDKDKATTKYGRTKWIDHINGNNGSNAVEMGQWFDMIWLPQLSKSTGGMGYLPTNYSNLDTDLGTKGKLEELISTFHQNGARVIADIVINHAVAGQGWCNYNQTYNFGEYGSFKPDGSYICNTDEMNTYAPETACRGYATGNADDGYGDEANYPDGRDWDHTNTNVQNMFKAYLKWLHNVVKVDGVRYDYCKGYHNSHINVYNRAAETYFSVMEYWDGNVNTLQARLEDAGWNTTTFDFATKYTAFNNGIASDYYQGLRGAGLPGAGKARYAVTFVDSHDSFQRDNNELCGEGNSMTLCRDKVLQCNAYMLSMPGVPCVFWPHWVTFKDEIKKMINARYKTGVHSESSVSDETGNGFYKATITGKNGEIRLLLGPNSGYNSTPSGYNLAVKGVNFGVYYKMTSARGDKDTERTPITEGIEDVEGDNAQSAKGVKFIENGKLYIRCGEQVYDVMGRIVK